MATVALDQTFAVRRTVYQPAMLWRLIHNAPKQSHVLPDAAVSMATVALDQTFAALQTVYQPAMLWPSVVVWIDNSASHDMC